jgi:multiple sugar transport system permease protein
VLDPLVAIVFEGGSSDWPVPNWLYSPAACKPALILMHVWMSGGATLVFLAALQHVPESLIEAAEVDGAGRWRRFRHVTLAHISPAVLFNLVIGLAFSMQAFDMVYLLYNRAQDDGLLFVSLYLYRTAFEYPYDFGYASAITWLWVVIMIVPIGVVLLLGRRLVYEAVRR